MPRRGPAIVGGATSTSNSAVAYELGRTPAGTHAHSMVQLFLALGAGEQAAFDAYADAYPDDTLLLVDTVDTFGSGVPNAIATFERLRRAGHEPVGIRLDSGDLAYLAVQSARELDRAGFPDTVIVLSSQLDELTIWQITSQITAEARRADSIPTPSSAASCSASARAWRPATATRASTACSSWSPWTTERAGGRRR